MEYHLARAITSKYCHDIVESEPQERQVLTLRREERAKKGILVETKH